MTTTHFDEVMVAMDVVDTMRHERSLIDTELSGDERRASLVGKLRSIYQSQGLDVPDDVLRSAVASLEERRFVHETLKPGLNRFLALLYVGRTRYGIRAAVVVALVAMLLTVPPLIASHIEHRQAMRAEQAREEKRIVLTVRLPESLNATYKRAHEIASNLKNDRALTIIERHRDDALAALETGNAEAAQTSIVEIAKIRDGLQIEEAAIELRNEADDLIRSAEGIAKDSAASAAILNATDALKAAAESGDRRQFDTARARLYGVRHEVVSKLTIRIVDRPGERSGVWRMLNNDPSTKVFYLVVEAIRPDGKATERNVRNVETDETEFVRTWAVRVPQNVYERVANDKMDDGIISDRDVGTKEPGYLGLKWSVPTRGETITRW